MRWYRARLGSVAAAVLLSLTVVGGAAVVPHDDDCHGAGCGIALAHDPTSHRVGAPASADEDHPLHCVVCHMARSARPAATVVHHQAPRLAADARILHRVPSVLPVYPAAQPPLRSPPVSSALV